MVFGAVGADGADGGAGGVGGVPELARHIRDFATYSRSEWIRVSVTYTGAVIYVLCMRADLFFVSST